MRLQEQINCSSYLREIVIQDPNRPDAHIRVPFTKF